MTKTTKSIYEKIIPFNVPALVFWPSVGVLGFFIGDMIIKQFGEVGFIWTQILFTGVFVGIPLVFIWLNGNLRSCLLPLSGILWNSDEEFDIWVESRKKRLFTFQSHTAKLVIVSATILAFVTIFVLGLPFKSTGLNVIAMIGFALLTMVNAHAAYSFMNLMYTAKDIANRPIKPPFYVHTKALVSKLQSYYSINTLFITLGYIAMTLAIWQGPYGVTPQLQIWLTFGAFYPLASFFWLFFQTHIIMQRIKHANLSAINQEIQFSFLQVMSNKSKDDIERLSKIMELQDKVALIQEWPIELQGTITFIITFVTATIQVFISITGLIEP